MIKKIPTYVWALIAITALGVFLRAYNFHDWLLFGPDQVRDAVIVGDALEGRSGPILLGSQAGNTQFYLGPLYYQFQYVSGLVFGNTPDKFAYPDLLFSILTIPVLFFFLKKYFSTGISLSLSALFSVSYFSIKISRFAVNSNALPFFMIAFLYGLLEMMDEKNKNKRVWAIIVGISLGVGVQLHALSFLAMPAIALAVCAYLIVRKNLVWKNFLLVLVFFLLANFGQLTYEMKTGGDNFKQFLKGVDSQPEVLDENLFQSVSLTMFCQTRSHIYHISSLTDAKYCARQLNLKKIIASYKKTDSQWFLIKALAGILFALGGYALWFRNFFKEPDPDRKRFLALVMLSNVIFLGLFAPIVFQAEVHYFDAIFFMPFIFLGLWIKRIKETGWRPEIKKAALALSAVILLFSNSYSIGADARGYVFGEASDGDACVLGEIIPAANYMAENSRGFKKAYLSGSRVSLHRFSDALAYLAAKSGVEITRLRGDDKEKIEPGVPFFDVKLVGDYPEKDADAIGGREVRDFKKFGKVVVYILDN